MSNQPYFSSISEFRIVQQPQIGKGSFGQVKIGIHVLTNKIYAVKIIDTLDIATEVGLQALQRQISIHPQIDHPHIIRLWQVLREGTKIYMIMEYAEGGNLFYFQNKRKTFSQAQAFVFFTQTLSAVQYLHKKNLIHRDLKPENLLLDKGNNIKICDLGWIIKGVNQPHTIFCGTYEYMSPQMLFNSQYDSKVDVWALGILLYQMLHGFAPFQGDKAQEVRTSMMQGQIHIDPSISQNAQDLIFNILKVQPEERLTLEEIKQHPWVIQIQMKILKQNLSKLQHVLKQSQTDKETTSDTWDQPPSPQQTKKSKNMEDSHEKFSNNKFFLSIKQKKKNTHIQLRNNLSAECINLRKSQKQKDEKIKLIRQSSGKNIFGYRHIPNSGIFSETMNINSSDNAKNAKSIKKQRLKTQTVEKSLRRGMIRFNTQTCESKNTDKMNSKMYAFLDSETDIQKLLKKKKTKKLCPYATVLMKTQSKSKIGRKSFH